MEKKKFSKFQVAMFKRVAQNVASLIKERTKLEESIKESAMKLQEVRSQIDAYEAPVKAMTGGFKTEDLFNREIKVIGNDKNGKPIKSTIYVLKYPDTIVPPEEEVKEGVEEEVREEAVSEEPANIDPLEQEII